MHSLFMIIICALVVYYGIGCVWATAVLRYVGRMETRKLYDAVGIPGMLIMPLLWFVNIVAWRSQEKRKD